MAPSPQLIFTGFMLPILLSSLVLLCLHWQDMRWQAAAAAAFGGMLGLAVLSARHLSQVRMTRQVGVGLAAANMILAAVGSLAVAPGTTDAFAYWVAGDSGIVIAAVYFILGPVFGLTALAVDLAALTAGLLATGRGIAAGGWVSMLTSPVIGAGLAAAMLAAFRNLSSHTESQLAEYRERLRLQARAEAISRVDRTALENARRLAGPVLSAVISSPARGPGPADGGRAGQRHLAGRASRARLPDRRTRGARPRGPDRRGEHHRQIRPAVGRGAGRDGPRAPRRRAGRPGRRR